MTSLRRYLCVVEVTVAACDDAEAATLALEKLKRGDSPKQVHLLSLSDHELYNDPPWIGVDFDEVDDNGLPYVCQARPLCFDFVS